MFEWNEDKNQINITKHGIDFDEAKLIFDRPVLSWEDTRFEYHEKRMVSIGHYKTIATVTVVHTSRGDITRIISARPANRTERRLYEVFKTTIT